MTLDGTYDAVIDRVEEGIAVVLIEGADGPLAERHVDPAELPPEGNAEGDVLRTTFEGGELTAVEARPGERDRRQENARERFDRLAERLPSAEEESADEAADEAGENGTRDGKKTGDAGGTESANETGSADETNGADETDGR